MEYRKGDLKAKFMAFKSFDSYDFESNPKTLIRFVVTSQRRQPRPGEFYLSKSDPIVFYADHSMLGDYFICKPVLVHKKITYEEIEQ